MDLLTDGFDTPEIIRLAVCGRDEHPSDLRKAASRAFASIGFPSADERFHEVVVGRAVAMQIMDNSISAEDGLREMVRLWRLTGHSEIFTEWMILGEAVYLFGEGYCGGLEPYDLTKASIPDTIRSLAAQFLSKNSISYQPDALILDNAITGAH